MIAWLLGQSLTDNSSHYVRLRMLQQFRTGCNRNLKFLSDGFQWHLTRDRVISQVGCRLGSYDLPIGQLPHRLDRYNWQNSP
jgi:hypothetical protein